MAASLPYTLSIGSRLQSFTSDVSHKLLLVCPPCMTVVHHQSPAATGGVLPAGLRSPQTGERSQVHTNAPKSIYAEIAAVSKTMMNETDWGVIEHVCSDGGAFKLGCACKCFPLIGSQKRFITRGEYRSATRATEKKFNSDLMSCGLGIQVFARRLSREPLLFVLRVFFLNSGD